MKLSNMAQLRRFQAADACVLLVVASISCALMATSMVHAQAPYVLPSVPYQDFDHGPNYGALEPLIDTETMTLHHSKHHAAAVANLNTALSKASATIRKMPLTTLLKTVGTPTLPASTSAAIRNNAGSHFNHAMYWTILYPQKVDSSEFYPSNNKSTSLTAAINKSFGGYAQLNASMSTAASTLFGSGWTWLCYVPSSKKLAVVSTPNQDNPLMSSIVPAAQRCIPILCIDVWEHSYYLKHKNVRNNYIKNWWQAIDWNRVGINYANAAKGKVGALWAENWATSGWSGL